MLVELLCLNTKACCISQYQMETMKRDHVITQYSATFSIQICSFGGESEFFMWRDKEIELGSRSLMQEQPLVLVESSKHNFR